MYMMVYIFSKLINDIYYKITFSYTIMYNSVSLSPYDFHPITASIISFMDDSTPSPVLALTFTASYPYFLI